MFSKKCRGHYALSTLRTGNAWQSRRVLESNGNSGANHKSGIHLGYHFYSYSSTVLPKCDDSGISICSDNELIDTENAKDMLLLTGEPRNLCGFFDRLNDSVSMFGLFCTIWTQSAATYFDWLKPGHSSCKGKSVETVSLYCLSSHISPGDRISDELLYVCRRLQLDVSVALDNTQLSIKNEFTL